MRDAARKTFSTSPSPGKAAELQPSSSHIYVPTNFSQSKLITCEMDEPMERLKVKFSDNRGAAMLKCFLFD